LASALIEQQAPAIHAAQMGNILQVSQSVDLSSLHPWINTLNVWKVIKENVYDQLVYQDPVTYGFKPKLAQSLEWDSTGLLVKLHPNVTFHTGERLPAADVKFTVDRSIDPLIGSY